MVTDRLLFHDLVGPERPPTSAEDAWLAGIAQATDTASHTVHVATSCAAQDPEPVLRRDLELGWRAGRYVGELRRDGRVLEIKPRLGIEVLAAWAAAALNLRVVPRAGEHRGSSVLIAELMAASWRRAVVEAARHGIPGFREDRRRRDLYVRGRLDVPATLRLRAQGVAAVASIERPKIVDNPVARSLVLADRVLDRALGREGWRGERVEEVLARLRAATGPRPALPTRRELRRVRFTPINLPYRRVAWLSWEIARHRGLRSSAAAERVEGLLIDVAELWELFVVHCARRAFSHGTVTHGTHLQEGRTLLRSRDGTRTLGRLYPDLVVGPVARPDAIIDAKYKPLAGARGVDREDLYQLSTYLMAARPGRPAGMLAYPELPDAGGPSWQEAAGPWTTPDGHEVHFVRLPIDEEGCIAGLRQQLARATA